MRAFAGEKYLRKDDGSYVPSGSPDSTAQILRCTTLPLRFDVRHWELVHTVSGFDENEEREPFTFRTDDKGSAYARCLLHNEARRFHIITEDGITPFEGPIELRIFPIMPGSDVVIEGRLTHHPRWQSSFDGEVAEERIAANLGIPSDRFDWWVERMRLPGSRAIISLDFRVFKEQIALSFDEDWDIQDIAIEHNATTVIPQYHLHVLEGPGIPEMKEERAAEDGDDGSWLADASDSLATPVGTTEIVGLRPRISWGQRLLLIVAALFFLLFAFSNLSGSAADSHFATFHFVAAVACLYIAFRSS